MKRVVIVQARTTSSRLPGKVSLPLAGRAMILHVLDRAGMSDADMTVLATSSDPSDDSLAKLVREAGYPVYRGSLNDVLDRFHKAAVKHEAGIVVRITGDCPLVDPDMINRCLTLHQEENCDYVSTAYPNPSFPDGLDVEVMSAKVLETAWEKARKPSEREHVTPYIWSNPELFRIKCVVSPVDLSHMRWTVDEPRDMEFMRHIFALIDPVSARMEDVLAIIKANPEIQDINNGIIRNEGYLISLKKEAKAAKR